MMESHMKMIINENESCDECDDNDNREDVLIQIGVYHEYTPGWVRICRVCLDKAVVMFGKFEGKA